MGLKEQRRFYEKFILDSINAEEYGVVANTPKQKLQFVKNTFMAEKGNRRISQIGLKNALKEWLMGLPTAIDIPFTYISIIGLAKASGSLPQDATDSQEQRVIDNYWDYMSNQILRLFRKYKVR